MGFPHQFPIPTEVFSDPDLPDRIDVAIIGGGIIGCVCALALAERGLRVALFEKGRIAAEQSCRNWGFCRVAGRDLREIPLALASLRLWDGLQEKTGVDIGFRRQGLLKVYRTDAERAHHEKWLERARDYDLNARLIERAELSRFLGMDAANRYAGALVTPEDGRAEPQLAAPAIAEAARATGRVTIHGNCAVRGIDRAAGRVAGVVTEQGFVACQAALVAGGVWSRLFLKTLGIRFPQLSVRASAMRVMPHSGHELPEAAFFSSQFAFRRHLDGSVTLARGISVLADLVPDSFVFFRDFLPALLADLKTLYPRLGPRFFEVARRYAPPRPEAPGILEEVRTYAPSPHEPFNREAYRHAGEMFPALRQAKVIQQWAGYIDATPDAVPAISAIETVPGLFLASGFSGHGFGIGPGAGYLAADLIAGDTPRVDPAPFAFTRLIDGRRPRPEAGI